MSHRVSLRARLGVSLFAAVSVAIAVLILARLGAVTLPGAHQRTVRAWVADAEGLPAQADVLVRGVAVGAVSAIAPEPGGGSLVSLRLTSAAPALHPDASIRIGFKTAFGEPFVDLDPGKFGPPARAGGVLRAQRSVEIDDGLSVLDAGGRADTRAVLGALGAGAAAPVSAAEVSGTVAELDAATAALDLLAGELSAQGGDLRGLVGSGRIVLDGLTAHTADLRALTRAVPVALAPLGHERAALGAALHRMPALLVGMRLTLRQLAPLIARATPLARQVAEAAPSLTAALRTLPDSVAALDLILARAGALRTAVAPLLDAVRRAAGPAAVALDELGPALADVIPVAQYLGPRGDTMAAWFANTADLGSHGDSGGDWARFLVMFDPATALGLAAGAPPSNAYTAPGDAARNRGFGGYPRLEPYAPALRGR